MYGLLITLGIFLSFLVAEQVVKEKGLTAQHLWGSAFWIIVMGVLGARLYHVIDYANYYIQHPLMIFAIWNGGLSIFGAILGGLLGIVVYFRDKKQEIYRWLDVGGIVLPLGQAIGRWGNYFNNELLPYSIYESFFNIILFTTLFLIRNKIKTNGVMFYLYLMGYSVIRLLLEPLRQPSFSNAQTISLFLIVFGLWQIIRLKKS